MTALVGVDQPGVSDASILTRIHDSTREAAAGIGLPILALGVALLLWFAVGLRQVLEQLSDTDPFLQAVVPAAALLGGLLITGVSIDTSSAIAALSHGVTPDPNTARVLGTAAALIGLTGLTGGAVLVAATTHIAHHAHALPTWSVWASYAVAALCLTGYWSQGVGSLALAVWLIGAAIGTMRATPGTPPEPGA